MINAGLENAVMMDVALKQGMHYHLLFQVKRKNGCNGKNMVGEFLITRVRADVSKDAFQNVHILILENALLQF